MNLQLMLKDSITHDYQSDKKDKPEVEIVDTSNPEAFKKSLKELGI